MTGEKVPMTSLEYAVEHEGDLCPLCRSDNISGASDLYVHEGVPCRKVKCIECGAFWFEQLMATGYISLHRRVVTYVLTKREG